MRALPDPATPSGAALRTTFAAVLAMALALALHVEQPSLAVVFVLARGTAGAVAMLAGGVAGSATAIALLALFDQSRVAFSLLLFAVTALATYASLGLRFGYAFIQYQLNLLILVGQALDTPDAAVRHAFYDVANVAIAAFSAFVAGASQPFAIPGELRNALARRLRLAASLLDARGVAAAPVAGRLELLARRARLLLASAWPTRQASRARRAALASAVEAVDELHRTALALSACAWARGAANAAEPAALGELHGEIERVAALLEPPPLGDVARRAEMRARGMEVARPPAEGVASERSPLVAALAAHLSGLLARLAALAPLLGPGAAHRRDAAPHPLADVREPLDRYHLRHAVKAAAAYQVVLWAWVAAEWGAIVPAFVVALLVATLATPLGSTLAKAALRIGGVLVGGTVGLALTVILLPRVTELWTICLLTAAPLLAFLLLQQRSERFAFASLQAAIALALTMVHGPGPPVSWKTPLDSLIGLAFGIAVVVVVMHAVWPIDATDSTHRTLARLLARSGRRLASSLASTGGAASEQAAEREQRAAARLDREHAAGFAHEVALYGAQFGRPAAHLAELVRLTCEVDALAQVATRAGADAPPRPRDGHERDLERTAGVLGKACAAVARELAALPGEADAAAAAAALAELRVRTAAFAARARDGDPAARHAAALAGACAELLDALHAELATPAHAAIAARRAA